MKKLLLLCTFIFCLTAYGAESFPNKHPELLIGKEVKVVDCMSSELFGFSNFYNTPALAGDRHAPIDKYSSYTSRQAIIDKMFIVVNAEKYDPANSKYDYYRITLKNAEGNLVYYKYSYTEEIHYPFEVIGGLDLPDDFYCDYIIERTDYKGENIKESATEKGYKLYKKTLDSKTVYELQFTEFIESEGKEGEGVILILDNNKEIKFAETYVLAKPHNGKSYKYFTQLTLNPDHLKLLKQHEIKTVRLFDQVVVFKPGRKLKGIFNCLDK